MKHISSSSPFTTAAPTPAVGSVHSAYQARGASTPTSATSALLGVRVSATLSVDFTEIARRAVDKGYESFVINSMVERAVSRAMVEQPHLAQMDVEALQHTVGRQFLSRIEAVGGFRSAYQDEVRVIKHVGRTVPEKRLEQLSQAVAAYLDHVSKKSSTSAVVKDRLIEAARTTASALRTFGLDDKLVSKRLSQDATLVKHGVAQRATELIDDDRQIVVDARTKPRTTAEAASDNSSARLSSPRMR